MSSGNLAGAKLNTTEFVVLMGKAISLMTVEL